MTTLYETQVTNVVIKTSSTSDAITLKRRSSGSKSKTSTEHNWGRGKRTVSVGALWILAWRRWIAAQAAGDRGRAPPSLISSWLVWLRSLLPSPASLLGLVSWCQSCLREPEVFVSETPKRRRSDDAAAVDSSSKDNESSKAVKEALISYGPTSEPARCHQNADSLFSTSSGFTNYRGILNLGLILLVLTCTRIALENIIKYGILINPVTWIQYLISDPYSWPSFGLIVTCIMFALLAFGIEVLLSKDVLSERTGLVLNWINLLAEITFPAIVVLIRHPSPPFSSCALAFSTVVFLKLISYQQVNAWCRVGRVKSDRLKRTRNRSVSHALCNGNGIFGNGSATASQLQSYPDNLNLADLFYFICAPTLCYELNFPRSGRIRKRFLIKRLVELVFLWGVMLSLIQQWVIPIVQNSIVPFQELHVSKILERLLKLAVPNHLIWLIFFYWFFHSCLNVVAELLRFGDRVFYRDWWNAETVTSFWQNWNVPVHSWATRHLYKPLLSHGFSKMQASIAVFLVSAFFHEYLVSVPLRMFRLLAFFSMASQVPFAWLVERYMRGKWGNIAVWTSLIIGQPIAILMYWHDYYVINYLRTTPVNGTLPF